MLNVGIPRQSGRRRRGVCSRTGSSAPYLPLIRRFTVLELIVVLGVVTILMAALLPRLMIARRRAGYASWLGIRKSHQIDARCIAYYSFEENEGTRATNLAAAADVQSLFTPTDLDATILNGGSPSARQWTTGRFPEKPALYFNGTDVSVSVPYHGALNEIADEATFEAWVYASDTSGVRPILSRGTFPKGVFLFTAAVGTVFIVDSSVCVAPSLEPHRWYHVVAVLDEGQMKLYLNGDLARTGSNPRAHSQPIEYDPVSAGVSIGEAWGCNWKGVMDSVALFREALPPAEVRQVYQQGRALVGQ